MSLFIVRLLLNCNKYISGECKHFFKHRQKNIENIKRNEIKHRQKRAERQAKLDGQEKERQNKLSQYKHKEEVINAKIIERENDLVNKLETGHLDPADVESFKFDIFKVSLTAYFQFSLRFAFKR